MKNDFIQEKWKKEYENKIKKDYQQLKKLLPALIFQVYNAIPSNVNSQILHLSHIIHQYCIPPYSTKLFVFKMYDNIQDNCNDVVQKYSCYWSHTNENGQNMYFVNMKYYCLRYKFPFPQHLPLSICESCGMVGICHSQTRPRPKCCINRILCHSCSQVFSCAICFTYRCHCCENNALKGWINWRCLKCEPDTKNYKVTNQNGNLKNLENYQINQYRDPNCYQLQGYFVL